MAACTSEIDAKHVAVKFLEQYHSNVLPKEVTLDDNTYLITLVTGVIEKKTVQVKIDANTARVVGVNYPIDFARIVDNILELNSQIRYALVVNSKGFQVYSKIAYGKTNLIINEHQICNLSSDLHILKKLLRMYDESLGKTTFTYFQREKIHIMIFHIGDLIVCVSCERSLSDNQVIEISNNIKALLEKRIIPH